VIAYLDSSVLLRVVLGQRGSLVSERQLKRASQAPSWKLNACTPSTDCPSSRVSPGVKPRGAAPSRCPQHAGRRSPGDGPFVARALRGYVGHL
jgi:hypothetical protein